MRKRVLGLLLAGLLASLGLVATNTAANAATPLQITTSSLPSAYVGTKFPSTSLKATGGTSFLGAYKWSVVTGALPAGLKLSSGGQISGTAPGYVTTVNGIYSFTVQVTDLKNVVATKDLQIQIKGAEITTASLPVGKKGYLYYTQLKVAGACYKYGFDWGVVFDSGAGYGDGVGYLQGGLKMSSNGVISGVPHYAETVTFVVEATCQGIPLFVPRARKTFTLTVN